MPPKSGGGGVTGTEAADLLTRAAIWLSLAAWTAAEGLRLSGRDATGGAHAARMLWTAGAVCAVAHVLLAFHVHHGWSQASAFAETARQTEHRLGVSVGAGLYVNYTFLGVWLADAVWWWLSPLGYATRPRGVDLGVRAFLLLIFVNGAIVFADGAVRIAGLVSLLAIGAAWRLGSTRALERA